MNMVKEMYNDLNFKVEDINKLFLMYAEDTDDTRKQLQDKLLKTYSDIQNVKFEYNKDYFSYDVILECSGDVSITLHWFASRREES